MLHRDVKGQDFDRSPGNSVRCLRGGGGGCKCQHRKTQRNYSFRQVRGDVVSFPPSLAIAMKQHDK